MPLSPPTSGTDQSSSGRAFPPPTRPRASVASAPSRSPFNSGEVILRTSDNEEFQVHTEGVLSKASPVFEGMFSIPQPPSDIPTQDSLPVIPESKHTIEPILRLLYYPVVDKSKIHDLHELDQIITVAKKYDMSSVVSQLSLTLEGFIRESPMQVFALACRHNLESVARRAASDSFHHVVPEEITPDTTWKETLPGKVYIRDMAEISSGAYYRLLRFFHRIPGSQNTSFCDPKLPAGLLASAPSGPSNPSISTPREPLEVYGVLYSRFSISADIVVHALNGTKFPAHMFMLTAASEEFCDMLSVLLDSSDLYLVEDDATLAVVLRSCYPGGGMLDPDTPLRLTASILKAAIKYKLSFLVDNAKRRMMEFVTSDPLGLYLEAIDFRWRSAARAAAVQLARIPLFDFYHARLEVVPAKYYQALLEFVFEYRRIHVKSFAHPNPSHQTQILEGSCWKIDGKDPRVEYGAEMRELFINFFNHSSRGSRCFGSLSSALKMYIDFERRLKKNLSMVRISSGLE